MTKIGRNAPCPCGSGKKYKKCHADRPMELKKLALEKAGALFRQRMAAERRRQEQFGHVRPIMHVDAWGKKLVAVGGRIYFNDNPKMAFYEFLQSHLRSTLGAQWWKAEAAKPNIARHRLAQWQAHAEELMRSEQPDERGRFLIPRDGIITALMTLAYDLYVVRDNTEFQERIVERLRLRDSFEGVRYELMVAATFVRAGFKVRPEDDSKTEKHPEFVATHRETGFEIAVEAKARNRRQSDRNPTRAGVEDLVDTAASQGIKGKPFALFVDVVMPPSDSDQPPSWANEVDQTVQDVVQKHGGMPGPFDWVVFTNTPHRFGEPGGADPPRQWVEWVPRATRVPFEIHEVVIQALQQYGAIPDFETDSQQV